MSELTIRLKVGRTKLAQKARDLSSIGKLGDITPVGSTAAARFMASYDEAQTIYKAYLSLFDELMELAIIEDESELFPIDTDTQGRASVQALYLDLTVKYRTLQGASTALHTSTMETSAIRSTRTFLRKIPLRTFDGKFSDWPQYRDIYLSLVHRDDGIPIIEKFHHLLGSLSGEALSLVSMFPIVEENYEKAWKELLDRYDNKRLLAAHYFRQICDFKPKNAGSDLSSLQTFLKVIGENFAAIASLNIPNEGDFLKLTLALERLDSSVREEFETKQLSNEFPTYESLLTFVRQRCQILELSNNKLSSISDSPSSSHSQRKSKVLSTVASKTTSSSSHNYSHSAHRYNCPHCSKGHLLVFCHAFKALPGKKRYEVVANSRLCHNCLRSGHIAPRCQSKYRCIICQRRHHTLLHEAALVKPDACNTDTTTAATPPSSDAPVLAVQSRGQEALNLSTTILLGTAIIGIVDDTGATHLVRAVLDSGSQHSIITSTCAKRLKLQCAPCQKRLHGAGLTRLPTIRGRAECKLVSPKDPSITLAANLLIMPSITSELPTSNLDPQMRHLFASQDLADSEFWKSQPVEVLIGCDLYISILKPEPTEVIADGLGAIPTIFGLVIMGRFPVQESNATDPCLTIFTAPISDAIMQKFWETEEVHAPPLEHPDDRNCEDYFQQTTQRLPSGRYMVALPFVDSDIRLTDSATLALSRFKKLEHKLSKQPQLKAKYDEFLKEYLDLGHMAPTQDPSSYVIPHHAVVPEDPAGKIRVVFDGSMVTSGGSLNDKLLSGPKLQADISSVIVSFRKYTIAFASDMIKMYRQIEVIPEHRKFQHIFWRANQEERLQKFELKTVTYGLRPAPYLALRVLQQLINDEGSAYPEAARALSKEVYVDDVITGAQTLDEALSLKNQLIQLLAKGCFPLHKWCSNSTEFLSDIDHDKRATTISLSPKDTPVTKILGMCWNPSSDEFFYRIGISTQHISKRTILSTIARLYDPMGFLAPVVFLGKCIMQQTWLLKLGWDDTPPTHIITQWNRFMDSFKSLEAIRIPRCLNIFSAKSLEIYGFCDASQKGFAAVLYLRVRTADDSITTHLLKSKTKLAPLKTISLPRLELSAAVLLVNLVKSMEDFIQDMQITSLQFFTDSTIVLSWLQVPPYSLQTFVANRVSKILCSTNIRSWHFVPSEQNAADVASRGIEPEYLSQHTLWWNGPSWISQSDVILPPTPLVLQKVPELKTKSNVVLVVSPPAFVISLLEGSSNYIKLLHVVAYLFRYVRNLRYPTDRTAGALSVNEVDRSFNFCVATLQRHYFEEEFDFTTNNTATSKRLRSLNVFQDEVGVLRVGGRLRHSNLPYNVKHPILLPNQANFTRIHIDYIHHTFYHLGAKALQAHIQRQFHIFGIRSLIKHRIFECLICYKSQARPVNPFMGDLPPSRVQPGRPFSIVGIDFAGPFFVKQSLRRNASSVKCYLCIFVCFKTKATHLELVSALSTDAFLAAFDRFIARRGLPSQVHTDRGTNFIGAARRITELYKWLNKHDTSQLITGALANKGISFHFLTAASPHLGGLWEAAVKSAKRHLVKVLADRPFSYEELATIFARTEAILNSRPLCPVSSNPDNNDYLTPGHFLIGAPLLAAPERDITHLKLNTLSRWQLLQNSVQHFWKRWVNEYLHTLQQRVKWTSQTKNINKGDLVLLYEPTIKPLDWKLGRVIDVHPGHDNVIRMVTVRTGTGTQKRLVARVISLPQLERDSKTSLF